MFVNATSGIGVESYAIWRVGTALDRFRPMVITAHLEALYVKRHLLAYELHFSTNAFNPLRESDRSTTSSAWVGEYKDRSPILKPYGVVESSFSRSFMLTM
ncbi:hypothetical protein DPMN_150446 [Dreissena polymorpha]|uniref:Uncharacterized protein n=1 Tax=Dreissena polymorpha TaxID=45954 RepID=A0A9D4FDC2_DREPO|nr:hypothetical protein DPMN_150446 [Dreissena polymorpha]